MPHLSPMSWLLAIITFWALASALMSTFWWTYMHQFSSSLNTSHKNQTKYWAWY